jgi:O-6-methylguanine DNA methyltransferase
MIRYDIAPTAFGDLGLAASERGLVRLSLPHPHPRQLLLSLLANLEPRRGVEFVLTEDPSFFAELASRLRSFSLGAAAGFDDIALDLRGTPFQIAVWQATRAIPRGQTRSYKQIAETVGRPGACRAVGAAMAANPVALIIPCHRVIGAGGSLCAFGGGLPLKRRLLALEQGQPIL